MALLGRFHFLWSLYGTFLYDKFVQDWLAQQQEDRQWLQKQICEAMPQELT